MRSATKYLLTAIITLLLVSDGQSYEFRRRRPAAGGGGGAPVTQVFFGTNGSNLAPSTTVYMSAAGNAGSTRSTAAVVELPIFAGTVDNLRVQLTGDVGGVGNDATFTVQKDTGGGFADTSQTCTVTGSAGSDTACSESASGASFAEGDRIAVKVTTTAGVSAVGMRIAWSWTSSDNDTSMLFGGNYNHQNNTRCTRPDGLAEFTNTCGSVNAPAFFALVPESGFTVTGMIARDSGGLSSGTRTITFWKDGAADTTFQVTLNSTTQQASDLTGSVSLTGGTSYIGGEATSSSASPATGTVSVVYRLTHSSQRWMSVSCRTFISLDSNTRPYKLVGQTGHDFSDSASSIASPVSFTITSLSARIDTDPGGTASWAFTVREAGVSGSSVTINSGSTQASSSGLSDTIDQDDQINWQITPTNTPAATDDTCITFVGDV